MPRKTSQTAKKDTATAESKSEGGTTRRSGRTVTKQEPASGKEASRSRRSSTAAQTAASVADSKTPKGRNTSSRRDRDSTSPSEGRQKSRRESVESPAVRVKSARRATSKVNYKESDEEEGVAPPKYDEAAFESNEEYDDSESESEKVKPKSRGRSAKTPAKGRGTKTPAKSSRSRRGRPAKKQSSDEEDDEPEEINLSEDSVEAVDGKKAKETPVKENVRASRGRRGKIDDSENKPIEGKSKSRRSSRSSAIKEEPPKKRPSRGVQKKKYTEDDDDDEIEEIDDTKVEDETKPQEDGSRKRKRGSTSESNKRLKEEENIESQEKEEVEAEKVEDDDETSKKASETKPEIVESQTEKEEKKELVEEPMEVDLPEDIDKKDSNEFLPIEKEKELENKSELVAEKVTKTEVSQKSEFSTSKEKLNISSKQESIDSSENLDESMHSFDSDQGSRAEQSISSGLEDSQDIKETKPVEKPISQDSSVTEKVKSQIDYQPESSNSFEELDDSSESKGVSETITNSEKIQEVVGEKCETNEDSKSEKFSDNFQNDLKENKTVGIEKTSVSPSVSPAPAPVTHSREANSESSFNGAENPISNTAHVIHSTSAVNLHPEDTAPKANGGHDLHNNSISESDQSYVFSGRKYIMNAKLGDSIRQSVKDKSFGFVSYNLGLIPDLSIQKEKLLNELNKLDAHIVCMQQVSKQFYISVLEPSLDALGFKGTFSQPEESEKGIATFYKSSLFIISGRSEASLKHLIEKELESAPLDPNDRLAVKTHIKKCGHVLFTHFSTRYIIGMHSLTVANVQVPPTDLSIHALQVSCLAREVVRINRGTSRPFLLGGEFNMMESEAPYQLLRDGYLSSDMIEELQRRKDITLPGKENAALVNLLWKSFQHPSSTLCSCYKSVLDHEVFIPEQKVTSPDLLWYSSDSLYTIGVLDASDAAPSDRHFSLKADIAFSM